jgi:hypothetical protein
MPEPTEPDLKHRLGVLTGLVCIMLPMNLVNYVLLLIVFGRVVK